MLLCSAFSLSKCFSAYKITFIEICRIVEIPKLFLKDKNSQSQLNFSQVSLSGVWGWDKFPRILKSKAKILIFFLPGAIKYHILEHKYEEYCAL